MQRSSRVTWELTADEERTVLRSLTLAAQAGDAGAAALLATCGSAEVWTVEAAGPVVAAPGLRPEPTEAQRREAAAMAQWGHTLPTVQVDAALPADTSDEDEDLQPPSAAERAASREPRVVK